MNIDTREPGLAKRAGITAPSGQAVGGLKAAVQGAAFAPPGMRMKPDLHRRGGPDLAVRMKIFAEKRARRWLNQLISLLRYD